MPPSARSTSRTCRSRAATGSRGRTARWRLFWKPNCPSPAPRLPRLGMVLLVFPVPCRAIALSLISHRRFCWSPDGKCLATADHIGLVNIWDVTSGERQGFPPGSSVQDLLPFLESRRQAPCRGNRSRHGRDLGGRIGKEGAVAHGRRGGGASDRLEPGRSEARSGRSRGDRLRRGGCET